MKRACTVLTRSGRQCQAPARQGGAGYLHEEGSRAAELGRRGGRSMRNSEPYRSERPSLQTAEDVRQFLSQIATDLSAGRLEPKRANALCHIATSLLRARLPINTREKHKSAEGRHQSFEAMMDMTRTRHREVEKSASADN